MTSVSAQQPDIPAETSETTHRNYSKGADLLLMLFLIGLRKNGGISTRIVFLVECRALQHVMMDNINEKGDFKLDFDNIDVDMIYGFQIQSV